MNLPPVEAQGWCRLSEVPGARLPEPRGGIRPRTVSKDADGKPLAEVRPLAKPSLPLFFQCPLCRATLVVSNPAAYGGEPAPCCRCGGMIVGPTIATGREALPPPPVTKPDPSKPASQLSVLLKREPPDAGAGVPGVPG